jgi:hypothetical protein
LSASAKPRQRGDRLQCSSLVEIDPDDLSTAIPDFGDTLPPPLEQFGRHGRSVVIVLAIDQLD